MNLLPFLLTTSMSNSSPTSIADAEAFNRYASSAVDLLPVGSPYDLMRRSVRDIDGNKRRTFLYRSLADASEQSPLAMEESESVIWRTTSPSGKKTVIFRSDQERSRIFLELYENESGGLVRKFRLPKTKHGKLLVDPTFGTLAPWDPTESFLVYAAEQIPISTTSVFDSSNDESKEEITHPGKQNVMGFSKQETFGEKLDHQYPLHGIYCISLETGRIGSVLSFSATHSTTVGQPTFQGENQVVYTVWEDESPRRLGLIYCQQRPTALYRADITSLLDGLRSYSSVEESRDAAVKTDRLTDGFRLAWSPRTLPDGRLLFLANREGFETHIGCFALAVLEPCGSIRLVIDLVHDPFTAQRSEDTVAGMPFPGLFVTNQLPASCSITDDMLLLTVQWGSCSKVLRVSLSTGTIRLLQLQKEHDLSSQTLLWAAQKIGCVVVSQAPNKPASVYRIALDQLETHNLSIDSSPTQTFPSMAASSISTASPCAPCDDDDLFHFEVVETIVPSTTSESGPTKLQSLFLVPKNVPGKPPLIVIPHGGPHSVSSSIHQPSCAFLCAHGGYALLLVNYRGSMGFGKGFLESLPTRIGSLDVEDVVAAIGTVKHKIDDNNVFICGGSHGGFLAAHLTSQRSGLFRAAALRNPVINLPAMVSTTDIPDWCYVEGCCGTYHWGQCRPFSREQLLQLYEKSPIRFADEVTAPTLVVLGLKDLRVPPSQGKEWFYTLKSNGIQAELLAYDDDSHPIDSVASEAEHWVLVKQWFDEHQT